MVLLGKKTFWWRLQVILLAPLWAGSASPTRKSWSEFKYGLMKHEHDYDFDNPEWDNYDSDISGKRYKSKHYPCKHYGCNVVEVQEKDGSWIKLIEI